MVKMRNQLQQPTIDSNKLILSINIGKIQYFPGYLVEQFQRKILVYADAVLWNFTRNVLNKAHQPMAAPLFKTLASPSLAYSRATITTTTVLQESRFYLLSNKFRFSTKLRHQMKITMDLLLIIRKLPQRKFPYVDWITLPISLS